MRSWFDEPTTQMLIFVLFVSAGVLFDGAFSLWVSLIYFLLYVKLKKSDKQSDAIYLDIWSLHKKSSDVLPDYMKNLYI